MPVKIVASDAKKETPQNQNRVDVGLMAPGQYEVSQDCTFTIEVHLVAKEKRWVIAPKPGKGVHTHQVVFRMWTYDDMVNLRKQATTYDAVKRVHMVDQDYLNRLKIQKLMVSWTFGRDNPRLEIKHVNGVLTDESWQAVSRLQPNILMYIIGEMNSIYEYNN